MTFHFETAKLRVEDIERHLNGIERKSGGDHFEVDVGILAARESDESDFPGFLCFAEGLGRAARPDEQAGIVFE
jgi:hypothetical protein